MDTVFGDATEHKTAKRTWPLRRSYSKVELWGFEPQTSSMLGQRQWAVHPPSMTRLVPVTKLASSLHR
jgi:hypothetical protein